MKTYAKHCQWVDCCFHPKRLDLELCFFSSAPETVGVLKKWRFHTVARQVPIRPFLNFYSKSNPKREFGKRSLNVTGLI